MTRLGGLRRLLIPMLRIGWVLPWAVVRIRWPIGVLRGVSGLCGGVLLLLVALLLPLLLVLLLPLLLLLRVCACA